MTAQAKSNRLEGVPPSFGLGNVVSPAMTLSPMGSANQGGGAGAQPSRHGDQ